MPVVALLAMAERHSGLRGNDHGDGTLLRHCERSEAIQETAIASSAPDAFMDCFVAPLLAMTGENPPKVPLARTPRLPRPVLDESR